MILDGVFYPTEKEEWLSIPWVKALYDAGLIDIRPLDAPTGKIFKLKDGYVFS
jgi:hypothetical protein